MKVIVHKSRLILDDFFKVSESEVSHERFDGRMSEPRRLLCFERGDSVAALVYDRTTKKLVFVKQFRHPAYAKGPGWVLEVMAGGIVDGEAPEEALRRELLEEMGYEIASHEPISTFYVSPGGSSERIFLYYVEVEKRVASGGGLEAEGEDIQIVDVFADELVTLLETTQDAKTLIAIQWGLRRLSQGVIEGRPLKMWDPLAPFAAVP